MNRLQERAFRIGARRSSRLVYRAVQQFCKILLYPYLRVRHTGGEHLDITGPVIVAPVHRSHLDTPLICGVGRRQMRALAKESLFTVPLFGWMMAAFGAVPVRRGAANLEAMRASIAILEAGEQMVVYPKAARQSGPEVVRVFDGMSFLASRTGAAIVPVGIAGTEEAMTAGKVLPRRTRVGIVVAPPVRPPEGPISRLERKELSEMIRQRLQEAFDKAKLLAAAEERGASHRGWRRNARKRR